MHVFRSETEPAQTAFNRTIRRPFNRRLAPRLVLHAPKVALKHLSRLGVCPSPNRHHVEAEVGIFDGVADLTHRLREPIHHKARARRLWRHACNRPGAFALLLDGLRPLVERAELLRGDHALALRVFGFGALLPTLTRFSDDRG